MALEIYWHGLWGPYSVPRQQNWGSPLREEFAQHVGCHCGFFISGLSTIKTQEKSLLNKIPAPYGSYISGYKDAIINIRSMLQQLSHLSGRISCLYLSVFHKFILIKFWANDMFSFDTASTAIIENNICAKLLIFAVMLYKDHLCVLDQVLAITKFNHW